MLTVDDGRAHYLEDQTDGITPTMAIKLKRAYHEAAMNDGFRVLVDRLWPRGVSKDDALIDLWTKDIAPSDELREWFAHDADKWPEFQARYTKELGALGDALEPLRDALKEHPTVTLVFGAKDTEHNNAVALKHYLEAGAKSH